MKLAEKIQRVQQDLERILPQCSFAPMTWAADVGIDPHSATLILSNDNSEFIGSRYFQRTQEASFLHFTNWENLHSIIESKTFRLYNLAKMDDPREFYFAGKLFYETHLTEDARENMFSASFCEESLLRKENHIDKFNVWRLYGNKGDGVCIVFRFLKNSRDWKDFHLGKIQYGIEAKDNLLELKETLKQLNESEPHVYVDCAKFLAFHKSSLYKPEQEVRLLYDARKKRNFSHTTYSDHTGNLFPKIVESEGGKKYLELALFQKGVLSWCEADPELKIQKIILGYNRKSTFQEDKQAITEKFEQALGYQPVVVRSQLERDFWGKDVKKPETEFQA